MTRVRVDLRERSYDVVIENHYDALRDLARDRRRIAVVKPTHALLQLDSAAAQGV